MQSLVEWNADDADSLWTVIKDLLHEYHLYQWHLASFMPIFTELEAFCKTFQLPTSDIDIFIAKKEGVSDVNSINLCNM